MSFPIPKQDRSSFVGELQRYVDQSRRDGSLLGIMLIHFEIAVTAEGVESQLILEQLAELGCDRAQGFHFARPMPAADLVKWLRESPWALRTCPRAAAG